jgi:COMPASS component SWD2
MMDISPAVPTCNVAEFKHSKRLKHHAKSINSMAIDRNGEVIATTGLDEYIHIYDAVTGTHKSKVACKKYGADLIQFGGTGANEALLASVNGWSDVIRLISLEKNSYIRYYKGHRARVLSIDCNPVQHEWFASASEDATIKLWDFRTPSCQASLLQSTPSKISFDPLGLIIASVRYDPSFNFPTSHTSVIDSSRTTKEVRCVLDLLDSRMLDAGPFQSWLLSPFDFPSSAPSNDFNAKDLSHYRRDTRTQATNGPETSTSSQLTSSIFPFPLQQPSAHLTQLNTTSANKDVLEHGTSISSLIASIQFSPNGSSILLSTSGTDIMLVDAFSGNRLQLWQNRRNNMRRPLHASFHPSGDYVVTGSSDDNIYIYETVSGRRLTSLAPADSQDNSATYSTSSPHHSSSSSSSYPSHSQKQSSPADVRLTAFHPSLPLLISANGPHLDLFAPSSETTAEFNGSS